jgi:hypothetical protein
MSSSKSSPSRRLKKLAAEIPPDRVIHLHLSALKHMDFADHAVAMMGAGLIEKALEVAILSRMIPMSNEDRERLFSYDHRGPLSDLSTRIRMGLAMGIYGHRTFDDLTKIREVRNAFAHSLWYIKFDISEVASMCEFHSTRRMTIADGAPNAGPRARYVWATTFIALALKTRIQAEGVAYHSPTPPSDVRLP